MDELWGPLPATSFLTASDQAVEEAGAMAVCGTFEDLSENHPVWGLERFLTPGSLEAEGWHGVVGVTADRFRVLRVQACSETSGQPFNLSGLCF